MPSPPPVHASNRLLDALPAEDRGRLLAACETVELAFAETLYRAGEPIVYIYFPTGSFISLVTPLAGTAGLEVGMVGNEGMLGITLMLSVDAAPFHAVVQGAGSALRMPVAAYRRELERSPALRRALRRYLYVQISQLAQNAGCMRFHIVESRLARWLLMTQDRAHSDRFHVTHIFLAYMLGVRRVGVTKAANWLQQQNLISYRRGDITILDRVGLEAAACACYQAGKDTYTRILE